MNIEEIARFAKIKGLNLIGTGDFTHPEWIKEIQKTLAQENGTSLYRPIGLPDSPIHFILTTEVCTIFDYQNESKKIHHVILTPSIETANQINDALKAHGSLAADGRPTLSMTAPQLVEKVMEISSENMVIPAHVWTPWFSLFGAASGFDNIEECYQDTTKYIHALETGLSSDPPMNWRLSKLDRFTLVSNSDCHSFWPWRIGREANVFDFDELSYREVIEALRTNDPERFKFTIETDPAYGKYHWTGHRSCNISLSAREAQKFGSICPVCRKKLTKGVEQRVQENADRPADFHRKNVPGYMHLLPLSEIIATVLGVDSPSVQAVWKIYNQLIGKFGDEYSVLINVSKEDLSEVADAKIAETVIRVRKGSISVIPGYDGVYGRLSLDERASTAEKKPCPGSVQQSNLADFL